MTRPNPTILATGLATLALVLGAATAGADVIRLRNGSMLQGTILEERTNENAIHIRLYRDGAVLRVLWDHVLGWDAERLRGALGYEIDDGDRDLLMIGHELTMRDNTTWLGLIEKEEGGVVYFRRQSAGRIAQPIPTSSIARRQEVEVDIREVYAKDEIVEIKEREAAEAADGDLEALEPEAREELASFLMRVGAYEAARRHFDGVLAAEGAPSLHLAVRNKLRNLEVLERSAEAGDLMNEVKRLMFIKHFRKAVEVLGQFETKFGEQERVRELHRFDSVKKRAEKSLREQLAAETSVEWKRTLGNLIRKATSDRERTMRDLTSWATRSLTKEILAVVAEKLQLDPNEVRQHWDARAKRTAHTASYGHGSFAAPEEITKAKARARAQARESRDRGRSGSQRPANQQETKPKTPEEWWKIASGRDRRNWLTAFFVENGDAAFEVVRVFYESCRTCAGLGYRVELTGGGDGGESTDTKRRCETCNGHGQIRKLRYR